MTIIFLGDYLCRVIGSFLYENDSFNFFIIFNDQIFKKPLFVSKRKPNERIDFFDLEDKNVISSFCENRDHPNFFIFYNKCGIHPLKPKYFENITFYVTTCDCIEENTTCFESCCSKFKCENICNHDYLYYKNIKLCNNVTHGRIIYQNKMCDCNLCKTEKQDTSSLKIKNTLSFLHHDICNSCHSDTDYCDYFYCNNDETECILYDFNKNKHKKHKNDTKEYIKKRKEIQKLKKINRKISKLSNKNKIKNYFLLF